MPAILNPIASYFDNDGSPLDGGYIFFGSPNGNPEASPQTVYWDEAQTVPAAQPIRTINGFPSRNGTPARISIRLAARWVDEPTDDTPTLRPARSPR